MSNPFANGSAVSAPMSTRPSTAPTAVQPADQYWNQSYKNLSHEDAAIQRDMERGRLIERGRSLAGFELVDARSIDMGFVWKQRRAPAWPAQMPAPAIAAVERAIDAVRQARAALDGAVMAFELWQRDHPNSSPERVKSKYDELTEDLLPVAQKTEQQLDLVLAAAAGLVEAIEEWRHVEDTADARRSAAERQYRATLNKIDTELMVVRQAVQRAGVTV